MTQSPLRILAIGAHPDDIELGCAGTLARCIQRGDEVTIAIVCKGDCGSSDMSREELARVRSQEARDAAELLGADLVELGLADFGVEIAASIATLFTDLLRRVNPDVVITHYRDDYGSDHNNTFQLVRDASLAATVPNIESSHPPAKSMPLLYMMEPLGGFDFMPAIYVDIGDTYATKLKMLECHQSQIRWMSRYGGVDFRDYMTTVARFRGYQCQAKYAEAFVPHRSWGHIAAGRVLP